LEALGHKGYVNCVAFSADGKLLASGSEDTELRLWEVATGKALRRFRGHTERIDQMALSPDGKVLASSCLGDALRWWATATGKEIRSLPIEKDSRVGAMTFTPNSKLFAFSNRPDKGIQLVDVAEGKVLHTLVGHKDEVRGLSFSADGKTLVSCGDGIRAWDVATGRGWRRYGDEKMEVCCLALAPDGKTLAYGTHPDMLVHIWDLAADKDLVPPWQASSGCMSSIAYSPDSRKVAVGREAIAIHETATGKRLNPPAESESPVWQVEYAADGTLLAVRREDQTMEVWETATWRKAATIKAKTGRFMSMAISPSGQITTAEGIPQGVLCHWDPRTGKRQKEFPQQGWLEALSYSADGQTLAGYLHTKQGKFFLLWDPATGKERGRIVDPLDRDNPRLSPDGRLLACGGGARRGPVGYEDGQAGTGVRQG
jgi:WD40 repeat protein